MAGSFFLDKDRPYVGWAPGDTVLAPDMGDIGDDTTILSITVSDDPDGGPDPIFRFEGTQNPIVGS